MEIIYQRELRTFTDPDTGVPIRQLTNYRGNSNHLYFTNNGWYDNGQKLLFCSDRGNRSNLFSLDLRDYAITRLTDLPLLNLPGDYALLEACVDPVRSRCYFFCGNSLQGLDLKSCRMQTLYTVPEGFRHHVVSCSSDADYVFTSIYEDLSSQFTIDTQHGYVGFSEIAKAHPESRVLRIRADGGGAECLWQEKNWIAHVNISPFDEGKLTFCHEGPWDQVDNRVFGMDLGSGKTWKISAGEDAIIGHEYWYQDGEHIGFHGVDRASGKSLIGRVDFHNTQCRCVRLDGLTGHIFSHDHRLIIGDGGRDGKYIRLWRWEDGRYAAPRALCQHFSSFKTQNDHAHPRLTPDQKEVLFTSDRLGYAQLYLAKIPEYETLPVLSSLSSL